MTELERLTKRLFSDNAVRKLVNFKLFRGDDVTVTQEQLCAEINSALDQIAVMQPVKSIDIMQYVATTSMKICMSQQKLDELSAISPTIQLIESLNNDFIKAK